ncbi:MAG: 3-hydroxyacyl-CoA dehydrogenase NAD-binding domain-containing protein, partial [Propionibacteriales bacterium]|nr:3-hydroxyacyl-CoA dehydrogenase NAD-binding domain-containing protein [Propionibacteriales bacterium]
MSADINRPGSEPEVAVVGLGTMGAGIVEVFAKGGHQVIAIEYDQAAVERGRVILQKSTDRAVAKGKLDADGQRALLERITFSTDTGEAAQAAVVVEAVSENLELKKSIFTKLDAVVAEDAVLATNTSSLSITEIAAATAHPERVVGVHFFNPAPVQTLVELISTVHTAPAAVERVDELLRGLGKNPIRCGDRAGFIVNQLLISYLNRAITLYQNGFAGRDEMDAAMVEQAGYPMGPFTLLDLVGLDVTLAVVERLWDESRDRVHAPAALLRQLVAAGFLGRKSGRGFHDHGERGAATPPPVATPVRSRVDELPDALVLPHLNDALRMVEQGFASAADVDTGMAQGCR